MSKINREINGPIGPENQLMASDTIAGNGPIGPTDQEEVLEKPVDADQKSQQNA